MKRGVSSIENGVMAGRGGRVVKRENGYRRGFRANASRRWNR